MDYLTATGIGVTLVLGLIAIYYARFGRKQHALNYGLKKAAVCTAIERFLDAAL